MTVKGRINFGHLPEYADAIINLAPGAAFSIKFNDYTSLNWQSEHVAIPTEDAVKEKLKELTDEYNSNLYKRDRFNAYPTVEDQLETLWDDMNAGKIPGKETSQWFADIQQVKNNIPKP
jgi:hypothetical protein